MKHRKELFYDFISNHRMVSSDDPGLCFSPGDLCMDATMGNGHDTAFLSSLAGTEGQVLAFDIQEIALSNTRKRLRNENCPDNTTLFLESHTEIGKHALPGSVSCITFNFGYLPGGDHAKATHPETSLAAVKAALPASESRRPFKPLHLQWSGYGL